jgi:lipoprotein-releasing system ATP-binding protein
MNKNMKPETVMSVKELKKEYRTGREILTVFQDVSFSIERGAFVTLTGESGSGKSTLLNIIGGLDLPTAGSVHVGPLEITGLGERQLTGYRNRFIGFVFQFHYLLKEFNAIENVMLPSWLSGTSGKTAREKAEHLLEIVGLSDRIDHYPSRLSGGEQQRVAVARALINDPELILADEPTGNLDEKNSAVVVDLLQNIVREQNTSLIMVTHSPDLATIGDRGLFLKSKKLYEGTPEW